MAKGVLLSLVEKLVHRYNYVTGKSIFPVYLSTSKIGQGLARDLVLAALYLNLLDENDTVKTRDSVRERLKQWWLKPDFDCSEQITILLDNAKHDVDFETALEILHKAQFKVEINEAERTVINKIASAYSSLLSEDSKISTMGDPVELKVTPRYYSGDITENITNWCDSFQRISASNNWSDQKACTMLPIFLLNSAADFYNYQNGLPEAEKPKSWKSWREKLIERFQNTDYIETLRTTLYARKMKDGESPVQFLNSMVETAFKIDSEFSQLELVRVICRALTPEVLKLCSAVEKSSIAKLHQSLTEVEKTLTLLKITTNEKSDSDYQSRIQALEKQINELKVHQNSRGQQQRDRGPRGGSRGRSQYHRPNYRNNYGQNQNPNSYRGNSRGHRGAQRGNRGGYNRGRTFFRGNTGRGAFVPQIPGYIPYGFYPQIPNPSQQMPNQGTPNQGIQEIQQVPVPMLTWFPQNSKN